MSWNERLRAAQAALAPDAYSIAKAIAAERERCARVVETFAENNEPDSSKLAAAIRGRKDD